MSLHPAESQIHLPRPKMLSLLLVVPTWRGPVPVPGRRAVLHRAVLPTATATVEVVSLKTRLLESCEAFKAAQEAQWAADAEAGAADPKTPLQAEEYAAAPAAPRCNTSHHTSAPTRT